MSEFTERSRQGPGHSRPTGPALWRAMHQAGRRHQSIHLQGKINSYPMQVFIMYSPKNIAILEEKQLLMVNNQIQILYCHCPQLRSNSSIAFSRHIVTWKKRASETFI